MVITNRFFYSFQREQSYEKLHKDQTRQDKRIKALKERMKKGDRGKTAKNSGAPEDEFLEDEEEGNEQICLLI